MEFYIEPVGRIGDRIVPDLTDCPVGLLDGFCFIYGLVIKIEAEPHIIGQGLSGMFCELFVLNQAAFGGGAIAYTDDYVFEFGSGKREVDCVVMRNID